MLLTNSFPSTQQKTYGCERLYATPCIVTLKGSPFPKTAIAKGLPVARSWWKDIAEKRKNYVINLVSAKKVVFLGHSLSPDLHETCERTY